MNTTEELPRISLVTPSFNQGEFIERTIQSVLSQKYPNLEYIIMDGGSKDNTLQTIKQYEEQINFWVSEPDNGQGAAIIRGFENSTGDIFGWLNSDDCLEPGTLLYVGQFFARNPHIDWLIANDIVEIDGWSYPNIPQRRVSLRTLLSGQILYQDSIFFRRDSYYSTKGINPSIWGAIDYDLWLQFLINNNPYRVLPDCTLTRFVVHSSQKSSDLKKYLTEAKAVRVSRTDIQPDILNLIQTKAKQRSAVIIRRLNQLSLPGIKFMLQSILPRSWYFHDPDLPKFDRVKQGKQDIGCPLCHNLTTNFHLTAYDNRFNQPGLYEIVWCNCCDVGITRPQLNKQELTTLYEKFYSNSDSNEEETQRIDETPKIKQESKIQKKNIHPFKRYIRQLTSSRPVIPTNWNGKLLDFGCNDGEQLERYRELGQFDQLCGFDINPIAAKRTSNKGFDVYCGDIEEAHWQDHTFDVIVLSQVIEHLPDPVLVLKTLHKKLKPNGHLLITCPNAHSFWAKAFGLAWSHWHVPYHLFHYTPQSISRLGLKAGFKVKNIETRSPAYWLFLSLHLSRYYARGEYLDIPIYPQPNRWDGFQAAFCQILSLFTCDRFQRGEMISAEFQPIPAE